ncbi:MAG TPA: urea ABC transporter permease subunit UrtB [Burkholderiales bacterium]
MPKSRLIALLLAGWLLALAAPAHALDAAAVAQLAAEDSAAKIEAVGKLAADGDAAAIPILRALQNDELYAAEGRILIVRGDAATDALTGEPVDTAAAAPEPIVVNNRIRNAIDSALAGLRLVAPERELRLAAARELAGGAGAAMLPLIRAALERESDAEIADLLAQAAATIEIGSPDPEVRRGAVRVLGRSDRPQTLELLAGLLRRNADGDFVEPDAAVRAEAEAAIATIEARLFVPRAIGALFSGLSLGSVLLLAALGLAITFGLMGIINMAHGEMLMIGAYTTFVVQTIFRRYFPEAFDAYLLVAVPAAFLAAGLVGVALERTIIRHLYGRPLETLLTTWGISLILIQAVRTVFGAQNVEVANPSWMSGGFHLGADVVLPSNRVAIVLFAALVVLLVGLFLARTRLGLCVRAVTQNRAMADCMGIPTPRVDWMTFGLGSGIAGLGGVALSQIGNVGPDLGQSYIVDSFMVVVLGGVGQLWGTIIAAIGLGEVNKFLEPYAGAVLGKIFVLVFIILFIQKRPQGLFALKGRAAEA